MKNERASRANDAYAVLDRFNAVSVNYSRVSESTYEKSTVFPGAPCRHVLQSPPTRRIWRDTRVPRRCAQSPRASMRRSILPSFFSVRVSRGALGWMVHVVQLTSLARVASLSVSALFATPPSLPAINANNININSCINFKP